MLFLMLAGCGGGGGGTSATPFEPAPSTADQSAVPGTESSVTNEQVPASGTDPLGEPEVPEDAETGDEPDVNPAAPASTNATPEPSVPDNAPPEEAQSATAEDPEPTEEPPGDATAQCVEAMTDEDLTDEQRNELEDWANLNCEALVLINDFRSRPGDCGGTGYPAVDPVAFDSRLGRAAMVHSADMAFWNFFSHTGSDGSSFVDRISRTGF
jgi:uncharacterized protein YkwD